MVGASKLTDVNRTIFIARQAIHQELQKFDPKDTVIVSGGGKGVDTIVAQIATELGFPVTEFKATGYGWGEYKKRNLQIADKSDRVISFALPYGSTKGVPKCYHCENAKRDDNHEKTAGCWTGKENGNYEVIIIQ